MKAILITVILAACCSCGRYFSQPVAERRYLNIESDKSLLDIKNRELQVVYAIRYDSAAQNPAREHLLSRGVQFEMMSALIRRKADSLFNFGYPLSNAIEWSSDQVQNAISRSGRKSMFIRDDRLPRPLFDSIYTRIDSVWVSRQIPSGDVLLLWLRFGKREYISESAYLNGFLLFDVHFIRSGKAVYSRTWMAQPCCTWQSNNLNSDQATQNRWFTEENLRRLAAVIRKDLAKSLLR